MDDQEFLLELKKTFLDELEEVLSMLEEAFLKFERNPSDKVIVHEVFRYFHNIKGSSKTVGFTDLSNFAHKAENLLAKIRDGAIEPTPVIVDNLLKATDLMRTYSDQVHNGTDNSSALREHAVFLENFIDGTSATRASVVEAPTESEACDPVQTTPDGMDGSFGLFEFPEVSKAPHATNEKSPDLTTVNATLQASSAPDQKLVKQESIKVSMGKINQILNLFGEQVILQSALEHALSSEEMDETFIKKTVNQLKKITLDLQHIVVTLRMVPLDQLFSRLERAVRDASQHTGKKVEFIKSGQNTELDKTIVEALIDPLTHMVRNAVDHGIESPEERKRTGKPETGTVKLTAQRTGGSFEIIVSDDGKGLNKARILEKAVSKGLVPAGTSLSDSQIFEMIFHSGFSTVDKATEMSGRGVGMDVVRQQIRKLKGITTIFSEEGLGSRFVIKVPLSLAMFNGTIAVINDQRYVFPNSDFSEAIVIKQDTIVSGPSGGQMVRMGERLLRIVDLRKSMSIGKGAATNRTSSQCLAVVTSHEEDEFALLVDDILSQDQIVLKELSQEAKQIRGASGSTILGDGRVALVLDISAIIKREQLSRRQSA